MYESTSTSAFSASETACLEQDVNIKYILDYKEIWDSDQLQNCVDFISNNKFQKVCLQFPDEYLCYSIKISEDIKSKTINTEVYVLGDTSYGSCCVDEIAASHIDADCIIHFGHACLTKITRIPVLYIFPKFTFNRIKEFVDAITEKFTDKNDNLMIFYNVGYYYCLDDLKYQLSSYENLKFATLSINEEPDTLCWKLNDLHLETYKCIYLGQDDQSFFNLTVSINAKNWYIFNNNSAAGTDSLRDINPLTTNWIRRRYYYIEKCKDATSIGIVVGTLTAHGYLDLVKNIQTKAKRCGKRTYILSVGKINPSKLANFSDIDCFVLIGCSENNLFTNRDFYKPLVSPFEIEIALNPWWQSKIPENYCVDFKQFLPNGKFYRSLDNLNDVTMQSSDISLLTGRIRNVYVNENDTEQNSNDFNKTDVLADKKNLKIDVIASGEQLQNRTWTGLDPLLGKTEPAKLEQGRSGIAIKYTDYKNDT